MDKPVQTFVIVKTVLSQLAKKYMLPDSRSAPFRETSVCRNTSLIVVKILEQFTAEKIRNAKKK